MTSFTNRPMGVRVGFNLLKLNKDRNDDDPNRKKKFPKTIAGSPHSDPLSLEPPRWTFHRICAKHKLELEENGDKCFCPAGHNTKNWLVIKRPVGENVHHPELRTQSWGLDSSTGHHPPVT